MTGYGTGGTFHGAGKAIKAARPDTKIILAEPEDAGLLVSGIPTERNADGSPVASHPAFKPHPIQGWTPDFIPKVLEDAPMPTLMEELISIPAAEAIATSKARANGRSNRTNITRRPSERWPARGPELTRAALFFTQALASKEGLLTGISGGGTMWAALETAKKAPKGSVILAMLPDTGERYLSTPLYADIEADMNEGELEIAKSTPSFQLLPGEEPVLQK